MTGRQTNGRNGAAIPEPTPVAGGRSSKSRGSFWASFPVRQQGSVSTRCRHRAGFLEDPPGGITKGEPWPPSFPL